MTKGKKPTSSERQRTLLTSRVAEVRAEWRDPFPAGKAVSAVRGKMRVPVDGPLVNFESAIEKDFLTLCRADRRIAEVHAQRLVLHFTDLRTGKRRRYTPDFVVVPEGTANQRLIASLSKRYTEYNRHVALRDEEPWTRSLLKELQRRIRTLKRPHRELAQRSVEQHFKKIEAAFGRLTSP